MAGKILVTGATGNIGSEVVRLLKENNADLIAGINSRTSLAALQPEEPKSMVVK